MNPDEMSFEQKLATLKAGYVAQLPKKLTDIQHEWNALKTRHSTETIALLHRSVHTLIGTSGTFGFMELSQSARKLEATLKPLIEHNTQNFSFNTDLATSISDNIHQLFELLKIIQDENRQTD